jgi:YkoY family integral membrane protein
VTFEWSDLVTVLVLIVLEGLLSGDNALVLAVLVLPLPEDQQRKALRYGILGAFVLRILATALAYWLIKAQWIAVVGGLYLLLLAYKHFAQRPDEEHGTVQPAQVAGIFGLSVFWTIVIKADLIDLVFAVDSILAALGMTKKLWVIITGGLLGILMMRMVTLQVLQLVKRYPKLIDGAYIVIVWVGIKLVWEYLHVLHWVPFEISKEVSIGVVILLFVLSFLYARAHQAEESELAETIVDTEPLIDSAFDEPHGADGANVLPSPPAPPETEGQRSPAP